MKKNIIIILLSSSTYFCSSSTEIDNILPVREKMDCISILPINDYREMNFHNSIAYAYIPLIPFGVFYSSRIELLDYNLKTEIPKLLNTEFKKKNIHVYESDRVLDQRCINNLEVNILKSKFYKTKVTLGLSYIAFIFESLFRDLNNIYSFEYEFQFNLINSKTNKRIDERKILHKINFNFFSDNSDLETASEIFNFGKQIQVIVKKYGNML